jgi:hypothetical protein
LDNENSDEAEVVEIDGDDYLIRKIPEVPHMQAGVGGMRRISKSAFSASSPAIDPEEGMSTNSQALLEAQGVDIKSFAPEFPALARLRVSDVRALGLVVVHRQMPGDYSHCQVLGVKSSHRKKLLQISVPIRKPDDVDWGA